MLNLLVYSSDNLGDDIQTYCLHKLLVNNQSWGSIGLVNRDSYDDILNLSKLDVLLVSGWNKSNFIYEKSRCKKVYIGCHFKDLIHTNQSIGCRDLHTLLLAKSKNINSYLSYCVTLSLKLEPTYKRIDVLVVDIDKDFLLGSPPRSYMKERLLKEAVFVTNKVYTKNYILRFRLVSERLNLINLSKLVITSRLHILLPSLALGVPVVFVPPKEIDYKDRISMYENLVYLYTPKLDWWNLDKLKLKWSKESINKLFVSDDFINNTTKLFYS